MPTGPGDDILDAIEAGESDSVLTKKFKVNADQIRDFKALHYGLSNDKMTYEEIADYYPKLSTYFDKGPYISSANKVTPKAAVQQPVAEKPDFTKPVKQKQVAESTTVPAVAVGKTGPVLQDKFESGVKKSLAILDKEIAENDDVIAGMIRDDRYRQAKEQGYTNFAEGPRSDMPAANMLATERNRVNPPELGVQYQPVAPELVQGKKAEIQGDEQQARNFINQVSVKKPEKAKELQKSVYQLDAYERMKQTPDIGLKVNKALDQIESGEVQYNPVTRQLEKEIGFVDALVSGVRERSRQMNKYELLQQDDEKVKAMMEQEFANYDPDTPIEVPKGAATIGQMLGTEWKTLVKGAAINTIGAAAAGVTGGASKVAAPYIGAAVNAPEYYERGYVSGFEETYRQARQMGKSPDEAIKLAREQAKTEGKYGALEGVVSTAVGGRIGLRPLPKFNITGGFKKAVGNILKHSTHWAGENAIDGVVDGLVAGYLQSRMDAAAEEKGLFRNSEKNIREAITGELTFSLAMGSMTKVGKTVTDPKTYSKISYWLGRQDPKVVEQQLGNMVLDGEISQEDADGIQTELAEKKKIDEKIPDDIKDVSRIAMHEKIAERQELEQKLDKVDEALQPEIKEQIKKLNEEILEHSKHKKSTDESEADTEAETQADAEGISVEPEAQAQAQEQAPVDEGAAELNVGGEAAPAGATEQTATEPAAEPAQEQAPVDAAMRYTNPEGTQYVLRDDRLYYKNSKGEEVAFSDKAMQTQNSKKLVETIKQANQQAAQQPDITSKLEALPQDQWQALRNNLPGNKNINTITDLANAYNKGDAGVVKAVDKALDQQSSTIATEEDFERELATVMQNKAPKMDEMSSGAALNNPASENTFEDYYNKAKAVINELLPGIQVRVHENESDYLEKEQRPKGSLGVYDPQTNSVAFNLEAINRHGRQRNVFHEILHPIVNQAIGQNQEHLDDIYSGLEELEGMPGMEQVWSHMNQYFNRGGKIQKVEAVTQFLTLVADGKIDTSSMSEKAITKIIDLINKILAALGVEKRISTVSDIKRFSDSVVAAFQGQDVTALKATLGSRLSSDKNTEALDALSNKDQEDAILALIKKSPASISSERLKELIVKATGITDQEAQDLIDQVRKPVVPMTPVKTLDQLTPESKQISINKFKKLREKKKSKEPTWWQRTMEGLRNGSAWTDNPYRFITKITEDINKHYGLANKEAIPLGRQFEKTAVGRAVLKVDSFINAVVRGNIGDKKLGRLKGEKYTDFLDYLAAKRVIDRLNKQQDKQLAGEQSSRETGNVIRQDAAVMLEYLRNKYGKLDDFEARGKALQDHMDTMMKTLIAGGLLSKESYEQIKADNEFYAPFSVVQSKMVAAQDKQPVGISGIVKRIKGIDYKTINSKNKALEVINALGEALNDEIITPEEYFNTALQLLDQLKQSGEITEAEYDQHVALLENPGFAINDILDAAANMIYKAEGMALKNTMLQRLYGYKSSDPEGLFIQDVEGTELKTMPDGTTVQVPKPLSSIKVEPGMAPIRLKVGGKDVTVAVNKRAAEKLNVMSNMETASILKAADVVNKIFRAAVITLSPGFQVVNFAIDFIRTSMFSRYGPIAGKGLVEPIVNAVFFMPQYLDALLHSAVSNTVYKTDTYKQWMNSDSFSKGMFDNLFDNEKRIKEVNAPLAKRILMNFLKLKFIEVPGSILEQTHKLATHQRAMMIEGFKPEMFTALLASTINRNINSNMTDEQLKDASDRLNYEVQNDAGSPNFPQTHQWMKATSIFLQFFSARVKGEMTDYRRLANIFSGKGEGVKLSKQETFHMAMQVGGTMLAIGAYAVKNILDDDDEKEFNGISPFYKDNYLNIPLGFFDYTDDDGQTTKLRDYAKVPLRGVTATMNVVANSFMRFYKRKNPEEFKKMATAFLGNASPVNLHGNDMREYGESLASNLTPIFKFFIEYSFNRDTHNHRNVIPEYVQGRGMLSRFKNGEMNPWEVATKKTPDWAKELSKYLFDTLGVRVSAIELDHMENTMGNPTEIYDNAVKKRLFRSESKFPLYEPKDTEKNTSSATVTPAGQ